MDSSVVSSDLVGDRADARFVPVSARQQRVGCKRGACRGKKFSPGHREMIMHYLRPYCPITNSTSAGDVLPPAETVIAYSPSAIFGTVKFTWYCPGATNAAASTGAF